MKKNCECMTFKECYNEKCVCECHSPRKKDDNLPLSNHLETRNTAGEGSSKENMPVCMDNHEDTTQQDALTKLWNNKNDERWDTTQQLKDKSFKELSNTKAFDTGLIKGKAQALEDELNWLMLLDEKHIFTRGIQEMLDERIIEIKKQLGELK